MKKVCLSCGYKNDEHKKFCVSCGKKLEEEKLEAIFCPECGEKLEKDALFCAGCGKKISELLENEAFTQKKKIDISSQEEPVDDEKSEVEDNTSFCPECGEPLEEGSLFCAGCGTRIDLSDDDNILEDTSSDEDVSEDIDIENKDDSLEETVIEEKSEDSDVNDEKDESEDLEEEVEYLFLCPECGEEVGSDSTVCPKCGAIFNISEEEIESEIIEEQEELEEIQETVDEESEIDTDESLEEKNFCPECGEELEPNSLFCVSCGAKIDSDIEEEVNDFDEEEMEQDEEVSKENNESEIEETSEDEDSENNIESEEAETEDIDKSITVYSSFEQEQVIDKNEKAVEQKKKRKKILILLLLLLLLIAGVVMVVWKPWHKEKDQKEKQEEVLVTVPSVVDKMGNEAMKILGDLSLRVEVVEEEIDDSDKVGIVFEQDIVDKKVKKNSIVVIKVYVSKEKVEMLEVTGNTVEEAKEKLSQLGVNTKIVEQASDKVEKGKIISQDIPEGDSVSKGGTVTIVVSTGKEESNKDKEEPISTPKPTQSEKTPEPTKNPTVKPKDWSSWDTSLPSNVTNNKYDIETKTQYRSRNKETKTSTSSSLSGWTQYDTKVDLIYSEQKTTTVDWLQYRPFIQNKNNQIISEEVIERDISYAYCKMNNAYYSAPQATGVCPNGTEKVTMQQVSKKLLDTSILNTYVSKNLYDGTGNHQVLIVAMDPFRYNIAYKEKIGEKTTYYFYRYGSWGAWQDNSINSSDLVQVETRTMYRYKEK